MKTSTMLFSSFLLVAVALLFDRGHEQIRERERQYELQKLLNHDSIKDPFIYHSVNGE